MSVIAYRDKVLAADTLVTDGYGLRCGAASKIYLLPDGNLLGICGAFSDCARLLRWWLTKSEEDQECPEMPEVVEVISVTQGQVFIGSSKRPTLRSLKAPYYAIGRGAYVALGAMWHGASAEEAVRAAIDLHEGCGGEIEKLQLGGAQSAQVQSAQDFSSATFPIDARQWMSNSNPRGHAMDFRIGQCSRCGVSSEFISNWPDLICSPEAVAWARAQKSGYLEAVPNKYRLVPLPEHGIALYQEPHQGGPR